MRSCWIQMLEDHCLSGDQEEYLGLWLVMTVWESAYLLVKNPNPVVMGPMNPTFQGTTSSI